MPDVSAVIIKALPELAKWGFTKYQQSRASFQKLARKILTDILKERNQNIRIVKKTVENLLADPDMQKWLDGAQLPHDLTFEKLAGRVNLTPSLLHEFLETFTRKIATDPTLREDLTLRLFADIAESSRGLYEITKKKFEGPEQERRRALAEYRQKVREKFSSIMLFGDRKRGGEEESVFERMSDMQRGFVPLHLKEWREDEAKKDEPPLEIEDIFFENRSQLMLIRGLPGSGKTTLLRYLTWRFAAEESGLLPVYIRLKSLDLGEESLLEFIRDGVSAKWTTKTIDRALLHEDSFLEKSMIVLLDGIDEIKDPGSHEGFAKALRILASKNKHCTIIVTSRPISLHKDDYADFETYDLDKLTPKIIAGYVQKWFVGEQAKIDLLHKTLDDKPRMNDLAENPFLLSMICFTFDDEGGAALINRRGALYETCTRRLLARMYRVDDAPRLIAPQEETLAMLKDLALRFFLWQESEFPADQVNVLGRRVLSAKALNAPAETLDELQRTTGLIQRAREGYTFVHRSLWEYFTALALHKKDDPQFVIKHAANPDWEEVVRLFAGLLETDDEVEALVDGLWNINKPLALRVSTEVEMDAGELLKPRIHKEGGGNQDVLLLIDFIGQSLPLMSGEAGRKLAGETLRILFLDCGVTECEVLYHAHMLLEKQGMKPTEPGGLIYDLLDLKNAAQRQKNLLDDAENLFEWIDVEGGEFLMGDDDGAYTDERPAHRVRVDGFRMMKHPVTNRLLRSAKFTFLSQTATDNMNDQSDKRPLVAVTWFEAFYFSIFIGARLPTEAEWEFAARGGKGAPHRPYYFGDDEKALPEHAWFFENSGQHVHEVDESIAGAKPETDHPLRLANMLGNVWEWCGDWYGDYEPSDEVVENPTGQEFGSQRVLRGGTYLNVADVLRCAVRNKLKPSNFLAGVSFRCVPGGLVTL